MIVFMKRLALFLLLLLPCTPARADLSDTSSVDSNTILDSVYFTMDDGIESPKEMEAEAQYVYGLCAGNPYKSTYFDCECLSGAFLQQREKLGPTVPQNDIIARLTKGRKATCANIPSIAGDLYSNCMKHAQDTRELATDNEQYCSCAGNKAARDFARAPRLDMDYIRNVEVGALNYCAEPSHRPAPAQSSTTIRTPN